LQALAGLDQVVTLTKKHKVKIFFGTDLLFDLGFAAKQGKFLAELRGKYT